MTKTGSPVVMRPIARLFLASTCAAAAACALAVFAASRGHAFGSAATLGVLSALVAASWLWPIVMYSEGSSQAHHLDEGFFIVLVLLVPPLGVIAAFVVATVVAQAIRRRAFVKSLFNVAQIVVAATAGLAVVHVLAPVGRNLGITDLAAAALGAAVYFVVNSVALAGMLASLPVERFRAALCDGLQIRALLLAAAISLGLASALAVSAHPFAIVLVVPPFLVFRQALAGCYQARHDRNRMTGLFEATLEVHAAMASGDAGASLTRIASRLLRSPEASLVATEPADGVMAAQLMKDGSPMWLTVAGRSASEPFDEADHSLLEAIAAVGSVALANSSLYEERRRDHDRLCAITESLAEGVVAFDEAASITFLNPAAERQLHWKEPRKSGLALTGSEVATLANIARGTIERSEVLQGEQISLRRRSGENFPAEVSCSPIRLGQRVTGAVLTFRDISQRVLLEYHAFHDSLTGLPNRRIFIDRLQHALKRTERTGEQHAVLFVDIDRFKLTNDSLGHQTGDEVLIAIANRLADVMRTGDTLARFGGDEFTVLLENIESAELAEATAARILEAVSAPLAVGRGRTITASVSIGIAITDGGCTPDDVLHDADVAMYQAKRLGAGRLQRFDDAAMMKRSADRLDLEIRLRRALDNDELAVHYQPVVDTTNGRIVGAEALVRWPHPELGVLQPSQFIGLAEETGLIKQLGHKVLETACVQAREWAGIERGQFIVAVNLSSRQFQESQLVEETSSVLATTGLHPSRLCLEITEGLAMADIDHAVRTLSELKALGVRLAIDDFGTGYSSLNYLKLLPVDFVKLDRAFVQDLEIDPVDTAIVSAVMDLARAVEMTVVAEGVETAGQLSRLSALNCPLVQGYYLARPMTAASFTDLLTRQQDDTQEILVGRPLLTDAG